MTESTKNKPNLFLHLQKLKIMKKLFGVLLIAFFTLSVSTTYAIDYKSTFGIEVKESAISGRSWTPVIGIDYF